MKNSIQRKLSFLIAVLFCGMMYSGNLSAQVPQWTWVDYSNCSGEDYARDIVTDQNGNSFITGTFEGAISMGTVSLTTNGAYDAYLFKVDAAGNTLWGLNIGGANNETGLSLALDNSGNIFLSGIFNSNSMMVANDTLNSFGWTHDAIFVAKIDANGNPLWGRYTTGPGTQGDAVYGLATDDAGNVYGTGFYKSSSIGFGTDTLINQGANDIILFSMDGNGTTLWAQGFGGTKDESGYRLEIDNAGNLYVGGWFGSDTLDLGGEVLVNSGSSDVVVAKFSSAGTCTWARQSIGSANEAVLGMDFDATNDRIIATGRYQDTAHFAGNTLYSRGDYDMFMMVYDAAGNVLWYEDRGTELYDDGRDVAIEADGSVVLAGTFQGDTLWFGTEWAKSSGGSDLFLATFNVQGNLKYLKGFGGAGADQDIYVDDDGAGYAYVHGSFASPSVMMDGTTMSNPGGRTIFVSKLSTAGSVDRQAERFAAILLYPNPTHDGICQVIATDAKYGIAGYSVYDLSGRLVESRDLNVASMEIALKLHDSGTFLIAVKLRDGSMRYGKVLNLP